MNARRIVATTIVAAVVGIGTTTTGAAAVAPRTAPHAAASDGGTRVPCATDEPHPGTHPQGCVWDARHMGNGTGRSFVVRPSGRLIYVRHPRAHTLLVGAR